MLEAMNVAKSNMNPKQVEAALFRFGPLLHAFRLSAGKTQSELAQRLGVAVSRVNAIERGRSLGPGNATVARLEPLLHLTQEQVHLMRAAAARDRALLGTTRSGLNDAQVAFVAASLDAAVALGPEELDGLRQGLMAQVQARQRTRRFLGKPTFLEDASDGQRPG